MQDVRFPILLALNKIDHVQADKNITKIMSIHDNSRIILTSARVELFLKRLRRDGFIRYLDGADGFLTSDDDSSLKALSEDDKRKAEIASDFLFRFGSTGIKQAISKAVEFMQYFPVYTVKNLNNFTSEDPDKVFLDCFLVPSGTTMRDVARALHPELDEKLESVECLRDGRVVRVGGGEACTPSVIVKFNISASEPKGSN